MAGSSLSEDTTAEFQEYGVDFFSISVGLR
jgi:hypothetical protein